jgi:hypothetical protein
VGCVALAAVVAGARSAPNDTVRVLQMNLCNSGLAGCYTGLAVGAAVDVIRAQAPDVVTLNEVCRADVAVLARASGAAASAFRPAMDRRTGEAVHCLDGEPYGIAVLTRRPAKLTTGGIYPTQDPTGPEQRAWLCLDTTDFAACTTHLDNGDAAVASATTCSPPRSRRCGPGAGPPPPCWAATSTCGPTCRVASPRATGVPTTAACRTSW